MKMHYMPVRHIVAQRARFSGIQPNDPIIDVIARSVCDVLESDEFASQLNAHIADVVRYFLQQQK